MAIRFSDLITQERLMLTDTDVLEHFYNEVTDAIDSGELGQDGPADPAWMNDFIEVIGGEPLQEEDGENGNYRVIDWTLAEDSDLAEFLADWVEIRKQGRVDLQT